MRLLLAGVLPALAAAQFHLFFLPTPHVARPAQPLTLAPRPPPPPRATDRPRDSAGLLREVYAWRQMDFEYPSEEARAAALASGAFDPSGTLPLGAEATWAAAAAAAPGWCALMLLFSANLLLLYLMISVLLLLAAYLLVDCLFHFGLYILDVSPQSRLSRYQ